MTKVLFICHGNICRSPMAEFIFKYIVREHGLEDFWEIESAATSREEIGNDIYPPAQRILSAHGVPFEHRAARQINKADLIHYDRIIAMDQNNLKNLHRMFNERDLHNVSLLMDYANRPGDVSDPWYTRDFETAYQDIFEGCTGLFNELRDKEI